MKTKVIPLEIQQKTLDELSKIKSQYIECDIIDILGTFKGKYFYIDTLKKNYVFSKGIRTLKPKKWPLCRLKYTGNFNFWELEMYKYSDNWYDTDNDYMFPGGTIKKCLTAASESHLY